MTPCSLVGGYQGFGYRPEMSKCASQPCMTLNITIILDTAPPTCVVPNTVSETRPVSFVRCKGGKVSYSVRFRFKKLLDAVMTGTESVSETSEQAQDDKQFSC
jgi:hypothetical protein